MPDRTASLRRITPSRVPVSLLSLIAMLAPALRRLSSAIAARLVLVVMVSNTLAKAAVGSLARVSIR